MKEETSKWFRAKCYMFKLQDIYMVRDEEPQPFVILTSGDKITLTADEVAQLIAMLMPESK